MVFQKYHKSLHMAAVALSIFNCAPNTSLYFIDPPKPQPLYSRIINDNKTLDDFFNNISFNMSYYYEMIKRDGSVKNQDKYLSDILNSSIQGIILKPSASDSSQKDTTIVQQNEFQQNLVEETTPTQHVVFNLDEFFIWLKTIANEKDYFFDVFKMDSPYGKLLVPVAGKIISKEKKYGYFFNQKFKYDYILLDNNYFLTPSAFYNNYDDPGILAMLAEKDQIILFNSTIINLFKKNLMKNNYEFNSDKDNLLWKESQFALHWYETDLFGSLVHQKLLDLVNEKNNPVEFYFLEKDNKYSLQELDITIKQIVQLGTFGPRTHPFTWEDLKMFVGINPINPNEPKNIKLARNYILSTALKEIIGNAYFYGFFPKSKTPEGIMEEAFHNMFSKQMFQPATFLEPSIASLSNMGPNSIQIIPIHELVQEISLPLFNLYEGKDGPEKGLFLITKQRN